MRSLVHQFPELLKEAIEIGKNASFKSNNRHIENVVITGLGGSGIGGTIAAQLLTKTANIPFYVNKDYDLPNFVGENTLVIGSSYSGNTEETIAAVETAKRKGAEVVCITSGGVIEEMAKENDWACIILPGGNPPRAMFAYSFTQLFYVLNHYGIIGGEFLDQIQAAQVLLNTDREEIESDALILAKKLNDRRIVIYADSNFAGVAERFRQQLNENSKQLCWHHALPEMNHNELVGWAGGDKGLGVLVLRNDTDHERTQIRMGLTKDIYLRYTDTLIELHSKGVSEIEKAFYLILTGDWLSIHLAELNDIDPIEIEVINYLKSELARVK